MTDRFVRELLLGIDEVKPADRRAIAAYLTDVVVQRGFPLHVGSLWNALYFEWDLHEHGYLAPGLNPDRVRETSFGATSEAVPVGGFVRLAAGEAEIWAEVVYKEGRHPDIGADGLVPPQVSGAHAAIGGEPPHAEINEALILDFDAFGPAWNDRVDIARFERRGRLDEFGHVVMTGCYDEREAELDDAAYYARHLLRHHRDGLLAEFIEPGASDEELSGALLVNLATIAEIARSATGLATFNGYFFSSADFAARAGDAGSENPVGADFFHAVYHALAVCPRGQTVDYAAIGQRIRGTSSAAVASTRRSGRWSAAPAGAASSSTPTTTSRGGSRTSPTGSRVPSPRAGSTFAGTTPGRPAASGAPSGSTDTSPTSPGSRP